MAGETAMTTMVSDVTMYAVSVRGGFPLTVDRFAFAKPDNRGDAGEPRAIFGGETIDRAAPCGP
jgi:hypothetical protein